MTRDEARAHWANSGLTFGDLSPSRLQRLRSEINKDMISSEVIDNTFRAHQRFIARDTYAALRCRAHYFDQREAVTLNQDGFVGFAGWADDGNVQPILKAFCRWVDGVKTFREACK